MGEWQFLIGVTWSWLWSHVTPTRPFFLCSSSSPPSELNSLCFFLAASSPSCCQELSCETWVMDGRVNGSPCFQMKIRLRMLGSEEAILMVSSSNVCRLFFCACVIWSVRRFAVVQFERRPCRTTGSVGWPRRHLSWLCNNKGWNDAFNLESVPIVTWVNAPNSLSKSYQLTCQMAAVEPVRLPWKPTPPSPPKLT